jgi:hypothetical protein
MWNEVKTPSIFCWEKNGIKDSNFYGDCGGGTD